MARANNQCELCKSENKLSVYEVPPNGEQREEDSILVCEKCHLQLTKKEELDNAHWTCLNESMWSEVPDVQVVSWRMLNRLRNESWAADAIDLMFLDEPTSGLDPIAAAAFDELITDLQKSLGLTVILVTHDLDSVFTICDRVAVIVDKAIMIDTLDNLLKSKHY